ncbi:MAG: cyclase family protein [Bacteroidia bacterium]|nr:cyclase family protein [Bacteroidia bacterium]
MLATIELSNAIKVKINLAQPIDISMPLVSGTNRTKAWYVDDITISPVITENFVGDVNLGGNVNFRNISFNPHGNGTHTECVGHISKAFYSVNDMLTQTHNLAQLVSITPKIIANGDSVITAIQLEKALKNINPNYPPTALVIRTLPNTNKKLNHNYSNTNATYLAVECVELLHKLGIKHLLIDLPSVDKEIDNGVLATHHAFWNYPTQPNTNTITEMIYVPNKIVDGTYMLNIMIAPFHNDATPSKPVLFKLIE